MFPPVCTTLAEKLPISNDVRAAPFGSSGSGFAPEKNQPAERVVHVAAGWFDQHSKNFRLLLVIVVVFYEEIGHDVDARVTSVVEAGKTEAALDGLEQ